MTNIMFQTKHKRLIWDSSLIAEVDYTNKNNNTEQEEDEEDDRYEDSDEEDEELDYDEDDDIPIIDEDEPATDANADEESNQAEVPNEPAEADEDSVQNEDIINAGVDQAATDLDDLIQHPKEEVVFEHDDDTDDEEEEEVPVCRSERELVPHVPYNAKSVAMDVEDIKDQVCFQETKESPHIQGANTEHSFFHYHESQVHHLAMLLHQCFLQTYNLRDGLQEFGGLPGEEGYEAAFKEVKQLHGCKSLDLEKQECLSEEGEKRALEAITVMLCK